jgi:hypothetical protein
MQPLLLVGRRAVAYRSLRIPQRLKNQFAVTPAEMGWRHGVHV